MNVRRIEARRANASAELERVVRADRGFLEKRGPPVKSGRVPPFSLFVTPLPLELPVRVVRRNEHAVTFSTGTGHWDVELVVPGVVVSTCRGVITNAQTHLALEEVDRWIAHCGRIEHFADARDITSGDPGVRSMVTQWIIGRGTKIERAHCVLENSFQRLVAISVSLATAGKLRVHDDYASLERAIEQAVARRQGQHAEPSRRRSARPRL